MEYYKKKYEEALKRIKECVPDDNGFITIYPQEIFSELAEDERIKKEIVKFIVTTPKERNNHKKWIAWLEKQGEHANFRNKIQIGDKVTRNEDGVLVNLSQLKRVAKPADKVEPKFKVGDLIIHNIASFVYKVKTVGRHEYCVISLDGKKFEVSRSKEDSYHLWTIQDAKDGDVLSYRDGQWIFIYKEKIDDSSFCYHTLYSTIHQDLTINDAGFTLLSDAITPATKEQHEQLEKAMFNAGYKWNKEELKLEIIESKPVEIEIKAGNWYKCSMNVGRGKFSSGNIYYSRQDGWLLDNNGNQQLITIWLEHFSLATKEEIEKWGSCQSFNNPSTIKFDEPDIEEMVKKFSEYEKLKKRYMYLTYQDSLADAYRKGLEDMYKRLKRD